MLLRCFSKGQRLVSCWSPTFVNSYWHRCILIVKTLWQLPTGRFIDILLWRNCWTADTEVRTKKIKYTFLRISDMMPFCNRSVWVEFKFLSMLNNRQHRKLKATYYNMDSCFDSNCWFIDIFYGRDLVYSTF